jgi:2,3-bisphosphoglycerate-dependent phosphoglycerate mutase
MTTKTIASLEIATGIPLVYQLKADTTVESKTVLEHDIDHKV